MTDLIVTSLGGAFPTQAEGTMLGNPFYFRARHGQWTLDVTPPGIDPVWPRSEDALLQMQGDDPTKGWMQEQDVMNILQKACSTLAAAGGEVVSDRQTLTEDERLEFCTWIVLTSSFDEDELDTWSDSELIDYMNAAGGQWNEDAQAWLESDGRDVISIAYPPERWWMDGYWTNVWPEARGEVQP